LNTRLLLRSRVAIRFLAHAPGVGKIAWYSGVHFKQWPVTEFFVAKNESVMSIHKRLQSVCDVSAVDTSILSRWALEITGTEKG
jgi:hypothetical protein